MPKIVHYDPSHPEVTGQPHSLRRNKSGALPWHLMFIDTETVVSATDAVADWHQFRVGWTCYVKRRRSPRKHTEVWKGHRSPETLCAEVEARSSERHVLYVYASNPGFDLWVLRFYSWFAGRGWRAKFLADQGMRFILICQRGKAKVIVCATQNYFPVGVAALGEMLGKPKLDCDPATAPEREVIAYCHRDVEIIRDAVLGYIDYVDRGDLGRWGLTVSGQAFNAFRHRFLRGCLWVHKFRDYLALERDAYFGGRCEAFRLGIIPSPPFLLLDVNSLYPSVMHKCDFPVSISARQSHPTHEQLRRALQNYCVVARVLLRTEQPLYPVRTGSRVLYPIGQFWTTVCTRSLAEALRRKHLVECEEAVAYRKRRVFWPFVDHFFAQRQGYRESGNKVWEAVTKQLLVSLYGKFGQANPRLLKRTETDDDVLYRYDYVDDDPVRLLTVTHCMGSYWETCGRVEGRDSMPAVAAHVTDYGRWVLHDAMERVGWANVLYCDTDSIVIPTRLLFRLKDRLHTSRLGWWSIRQHLDSLTVHGGKDYVANGKRVLSGVPLEARETETGTFEARQFPGMASLLRRAYERELKATRGKLYDLEQLREAQRSGLYPVLKVTLRLTRRYRKGDVGADRRVHPYRLYDAAQEGDVG